MVETQLRFAMFVVLLCVTLVAQKKTVSIVKLGNH
jgi:hypothetical protein